MNGQSNKTDELLLNIDRCEAHTLNDNNNNNNEEAKVNYTHIFKLNTPRKSSNEITKSKMCIKNE